MRLLFVKPALVWPRSSGHDVQCYYMMKALAEEGAEVSLATVDPTDPRAVDGIRLVHCVQLDAKEPLNANASSLTYLQERFRSFWGIDKDHIQSVRRLAALGHKAARVRLDPDTTPVRFAQILQAAGAKIVAGDDPCILPKAIKNTAEIEGARAAHIRDGAAMARFLAWLDEKAPTGRVDEIGAAMKLEEFRRETGELKDLSFDSISAAGPHGAVVHYRPTTASNLKLKARSLYLIDSGGQYADGTTDITRTVAIGSPSAEMRRHYTLVLKGHIAVATARFPKGTRGQDIDPFARRPLWQAGLDFDHGTGHGVGSYLSVHEPPQRISRTGSVEIKPGMILSNEPGLYREGSYGIRLENLVLVTPPAPIKGGTHEMLGFETMTLVPFDRRLIETELLNRDELAWLNAYHAHVRRSLA